MSDPQRGALPARVVVRAPGWARLVSLPLMLAWWGLCVYLAASLVADGVGEGTPFFAGLAAVLLLAVFIVVIPPATWFLLTYRVELGPEGVRREPGHFSVPLEGLTRLEALPPARIGRADRGARVRVQGGGQVVQVADSAREFQVVLDLVRAWAAQRPELVSDEYSRSRLLRPAPTPGDGA
ncbi:hypothetical protein [Oryzobacter telluris]|uniref:hypothetical protein n=1 Tax=Oryzobacter telluris TaxID=3149179 RepID=UPI00370D1224